MKYKKINGNEYGICNCGNIITKPLSFKIIKEEIYLHSCNIDLEKCNHCLNIKCRCEEK